MRGGMWDKQRLLGGKRLQQEFGNEEDFILWKIERVGDVPVDDEGNLAPKTELTVSRLTSPDEKFPIGTLSQAIDLLAQDAESKSVEGDLPAVCHWTETETKRGLQPAVILVALRPYVSQPVSSGKGK